VTVIIGVRVEDIMMVIIIVKEHRVSSSLHHTHHAHFVQLVLVLRLVDMKLKLMASETGGGAVRLVVMH